MTQADLAAVNGECHLVAHDARPPALTFNASNRKTERHIPHLMQAAWSITCSCLRSPAMQFTGQLLAQAMQPVHLSSRMR